jgi:hypothetical protein
MPPRWDLSLAVAFRFAALLLAAVTMVSMHADPDLWGHVRFGLDILSMGHVADGPDPYSFTQDRPFIYHEWLGGTIMALAYRVGGAPGLAVLKALLVLSLIYVVWFTLRRKQLAWRWAGVGIAVVGALPVLLRLRPQLWTLLGVLAVCRILTSESRRSRWLLPLVFALWANLHGGWIVGGGLVVVWTAVAFIQRRNDRGELLLVGIASLAATLLNPYGVNLWLFLAETVRLDRADIAEWQPIWRAGVVPIAVWSIAATTIVVSVARRGPPSRATAVALGGLAFGSARVLRLGPIFVLTAVALLSRTWPDENDSRADVVSRPLVDTGLVTLTVMLALWMQAIPRCIVIAKPGVSSYAPDVVAGESLKGSDGRLVTAFNWGEYALWHFGPALKVSIDGRRETLYADDTVKAQAAILQGVPAGLTALAQLNPDYVWLPVQAEKTAAWLQANGYREDIRTEHSFIAVRRDRAPLTAWQGHPSGCFPGP